MQKLKFHQFEKTFLHMKKIYQKRENLVAMPSNNVVTYFDFSSVIGGHVI
jgi:hypothetical protein